MFELVSPRVHRIVQISKSQLVLHGARDMRTFLELDPEAVAQRCGFVAPRRFQFASLDERMLLCIIASCSCAYAFHYSSCKRGQTRSAKTGGLCSVRWNVDAS